MAPSFTNLKNLSSKADAKLQKIKCRLHKTKAVDNKPETTVEPMAAVEPKLTNEEGQGNTSEPNHTGEEGEELASSISSQASKKQEKMARREARREARKAKWAARRAAFKTKAKKVGEAVFLPCAVVLGILFAPVIIVVDLVWCVVSVVIGLVVRIFDLMCAPFLVCFVCKQ